MNFDELIERRNTHSVKWDDMEKLYGICPDDGIAMWVADMDFRPPQAVDVALKKMQDYGVYGYYGDMKPYLETIIWWMREHFDWQVEPEWIFSTHGLVNGAAICVDTFTDPGDGVVLFTPVYHAFARVIKAAGRTIVECPLKYENGRYSYDFDAYDAMMGGGEKMVILCSPQNPGGQVWSRCELKGVADFAKRHDLVLVSDEIHHDLVYPGKTHIPMALIDENICERLVMMTAPTKTFNIAGCHTGNIIIPDGALRARFSGRMAALGMSPNSFGLFMSEAAYSPEGAKWVSALLDYLGTNRAIFDAAIDAIPGLKSMPLDATYLAWVDFGDVGMGADEFIRRIQKTARIAANHGASFGKGGENFMRFNIATPRCRVLEASERIKDAFTDLQ